MSTKTIKKVIADFKKFQDDLGFVQPSIGGVSNNGVRYSGDYVTVLSLYGSFDDEPAPGKGKIPKSEITRLKKLFASCELEPGLLMRHQDNAGGYQSIDDTVGALTASYFLKSDYAKNFLKYGRENGAVYPDEVDPSPEKVRMNRKMFWFMDLMWLTPVKWVYNNVAPQSFSVVSWLGRFPHLIAHAQFAAGEKPSLFKKLWWCGAVLHSAFLGKTADEKILAWHLIMVAEGKSKLCDRVARIWRNKMDDQYASGLGGILIKTNYFEIDHPTCQYLLGRR